MFQFWIERSVLALHPEGEFCYFGKRIQVGFVVDFLARALIHHEIFRSILVSACTVEEQSLSARYIAWRQSVVPSIHGETHHIESRLRSLKCNRVFAFFVGRSRGGAQLFGEKRHFCPMLFQNLLETLLYMVARIGFLQFIGRNIRETIELHARFLHVAELHREHHLCFWVERASCLHLFAVSPRHFKDGVRLFVDEILQLVCVVHILLRVFLCQCYRFRQLLRDILLITHHEMALPHSRLASFGEVTIARQHFFHRFQSGSL